MEKKLFEILIGAWTLVELIEVSLNDGEITHPMGTEPKGIIIYNNDGYMSAQIMNTDFEKFDAKDNSAYLAYSGPFQTNDEKQTVSHTMYVSLLEKWRDQTQNRKVLFKDGLLHLETEKPFMSNSKLVTHKLTWKRIEKSTKTFNLKRMKAIVITKFGAPDVLQLQDYPTPEIKGDEVLIEVKAAGLNRSDIFQREGNYPAPPGVSSEILGLEVAGIIAKCGPNVVDFKVGDKVCAILAGGGYAEFVSVREGQCLPIPSDLSFAEAASLPETIFTVWSNVFQRVGLKSGETLLIHGGNSGIGITGIQIAHALGSPVIVTVGSDEKGQKCLELGADSYINYKTQNFETVLQEQGVDVILDMIGGDYLSKNVNILKPEGRLVHINAVSGSHVDLDIWKVMIKRLTVTGSTLRSRDYDFKKQLAKEVQKYVWPLIESKQFKPIIFKTFPFTEAPEAHRLLEESQHTGKIILIR